MADDLLLDFKQTIGVQRLAYLALLILGVIGHRTPPTRVMFHLWEERRIL